jgi:hypothetical protein
MLSSVFDEVDVGVEVESCEDVSSGGSGAELEEGDIEGGIGIDVDTDVIVVGVSSVVIGVGVGVEDEHEDEDDVEVEVEVEVETEVAHADEDECKREIEGSICLSSCIFGAVLLMLTLTASFAARASASNLERGANTEKVDPSAKKSLAGHPSLPPRLKYFLTTVLQMEILCGETSTPVTVPV